MRLCFLIVVTCSALLISCKSNKAKSPIEKLKQLASDKDANVGNLNFTFQLPQNWIRIDTSVQGLKATLLMPGHATDNFAPRINVTNEFMHGETHDEYIANTKQYLINNNDGIDLSDDGNFDVQGNKCRWYSYNKTQNGIKRQLVFYSIDVDGISYNITAGVFDGGLQQYKPLFDRLVKSFKLIN